MATMIQTKQKQLKTTLHQTKTTENNNPLDSPMG